MSARSTPVTIQERVLEIRLLPVAESEGKFETFFFSENVPDSSESLVALLQELIVRGKSGKLVANCNEMPINDTEIVLEFTLTEGQEYVDVWVDNFPQSSMAVLGVLTQIHADLIKKA